MTMGMERSESLPPSDATPEPLEVSPSCWMVGRRNAAAILQCNTYVRRFEGGRAPIHVCIDPGSRVDFPVIEQNIRRLVGDLDDIASFTLNHQDPDVVGNALHLCEANPNISAVMTEEVWRLAQHLDFKPKRLHFANLAQSPLMTVAYQHRWQLVPTPFCHFRGAVAFYDPELRTLFSGDLFGGLNRPRRVQLWAEAEDWEGIAQFHQIYMPTREALRHAVRQIRALKPAVEVIAPQHGFAIKGDLVPLFLERMEELLVGLDLLSLERDQAFRDGYARVLACLLSRAEQTMGRDEMLSRLRAGDPDDGLETLITLSGKEVRLEREGATAVVKVLTRLARGETVAFANALRSEVLEACSELKLPIPAVGAGLEQELPGDAIGPDGIVMQPRVVLGGR